MRERRNAMPTRDEDLGAFYASGLEGGEIKHRVVTRC